MSIILCFASTAVCQKWQAAVFIFFLILKESLLFDVDEPVNSYDDKLIIEGVKNLKIIEKGESGLITGELATGQKIRFHFNFR